MVQEQKGKYRFIVIATLVGICCLLTYYALVVYKTDIVFTHFFYIPIIIASLWWGRKGLAVAILLALLLIFSHLFIGLGTKIIYDLMRSTMFIVVALVTGILSEKIVKAQKMTDQVRDIAKVATAIANGDLTQKITVDAEGEVRQLKDTINSMVDCLNVLITRAKDSANTVLLHTEGIASSGTKMNISSTQVAVAVQQIAKGARDQAQSITVADQSVEHISTAAIEVASRAEEVNKAVSAADECAQNGFKTVAEAVKSMQRISEVAESASARVEIMTQRGEEIAKILDIITDIASQTNLLALNAAIEAARAGEAGRGFAVVAEEVRKLAESSKKSADEIAELVKSIQEETVSASEASKTMIECVTEGRKATDKSSVALDNIIFAMKQTSSAAHAISDSAAQQKKSIESVVRIVEEISAIAEETATGSEESSVAALELTSAMEELTASGQELLGTAVELQDAVARFKLRGGVKEA
uniref:Methyl-accepting chemotaxis protein n=1 Tax=Candidatus Methanophaga sp. ANME-1 ERB7 TaxID=2759913 RepID=A0A7G9Z4L6_9EURY|nr:hypothetical protein MHJDHPNH_00002 [Methanosarcinales archaeon ANME-1 ERB7]